MRTAVVLCLTLSVASLDAAQRRHVPRQERPGGAAGVPVVSENLAVQVMLDRAGFSSGEIDGRQGPNLKQALAAFQAAQQLTASGRLDNMTWQKLTGRAGTEAPLVSYTISDADVAGPFTADIPSDLMAQSKLEALGYRNALEALGERFHASPALLKALNPGASFGKAGAQIMVPNVAIDAQPSPGSAPATGKADVTVVVDKRTSALEVTDASGAVLFHAPVTSGSEHDPLPIGTWKVNGVQQGPKFHYNPALFWDADPSNSKATLAPGPNNPVGTVWIDINKEHYGIHGTPEPSQIGHVQSHGCVRLTNWDAQRVAAMVKPGTKVVFK
jgi:lipoprotein-anchoring transpeptidase ErfK/SrfK